MLRKARRNTFGDPKYHSGRKKKEFASPYLEFLDKLEKAVLMVQEAEALEKPGRPTFFETPAWSFNILVLAFVEKGVCICPRGVPRA